MNMEQGYAHSPDTIVNTHHNVVNNMMSETIAGEWNGICPPTPPIYKEQEEPICGGRIVGVVALLLTVARHARPVGRGGAGWITSNATAATPSP